MSLVGSFWVVFRNFSWAPIIRIVGVCQAKFDADVFLEYRVLAFSPRVIAYETSCKKLPMPKSKKNKNKSKLNLTVRDEQRNKLEKMASLESRSVSNLVEIMADERSQRFGRLVKERETAQALLVTT